MNRFIIFSAGRNCEKFIPQNLNSVKTQTFENYVHVIVDDKSDDGTRFYWDKFVPNEKMKLYRNVERIGKTANMVKYVAMHIRDDDDIIVELDLDDAFYHPNVLSKLDEIYQDGNIWCTHSRYFQDDRNQAFGSKYSENVMIDRLFKSSKWQFRHLRTYKAFLWNNLAEEDLKNDRGVFFPSAADMAISYPILEMAGGRQHHIRFIDDIQVLYHHSNINTDDKLDRPLQRQCCEEIRKRPIKDVIQQ